MGVGAERRKRLEEGGERKVAGRHSVVPRGETEKWKKENEQRCYGGLRECRKGRTLERGIGGWCLFQ